MAFMHRIIKLVNRYFMAGTNELNNVGKFHLKSYVLQRIGVVNKLNDWDGIHVRNELRSVTHQKKLAWNRTQRAKMLGNLLHDDVLASDTDLEDEGVIPDEVSVIHESSLEPGMEGTKVGQLPMELNKTEGGHWIVVLVNCRQD